MAVKLDPEQTRVIQAEIDAAPDWGGAVIEHAIGSLGPVEEGTLGDLVRWNGALWLLVGVVDDEMWLAPLAGVLRRPVLVQPEDGVLDGFITHRAPNNG